MGALVKSRAKHVSLRKLSPGQRKKTVSKIHITFLENTHNTVSNTIDFVHPDLAFSHLNLAFAHLCVGTIHKSIWPNDNQSPRFWIIVKRGPPQYGTWRRHGSVWTNKNTICSIADLERSICGNDEIDPLRTNSQRDLRSTLHCLNQYHVSPQSLFIFIWNMGRSIIDFDWAGLTFVLFLRRAGQLPDRGGQIQDRGGEHRWLISVGLDWCLYCSYADAGKCQIEVGKCQTEMSKIDCFGNYSNPAQNT